MIQLKEKLRFSSEEPKKAENVHLDFIEPNNNFYFTLDELIYILDKIINTQMILDSVFTELVNTNIPF